MKSSDRWRLEKDTFIKEWEILWERILVYDKQIDTIKNWCIVTLLASIGFLLKFGSEVIEDYQMASLIPILLISFFAFNELFKQTWKWEAFERLYRMEELMRRKFGYQPSFLQYYVRKKIKKQKYISNGRIKYDTESYILRNSLVARNFAFFYGLLFLSCSVFFPWVSYNTDTFITILFFGIGVSSLFWMFFSARDYLKYEAEKNKNIIKATTFVMCILILVILVISYSSLILPILE